MEPRFDVEQVFDEDYLYFYEPLLTDEVSDAQTETVWRLLELEPGAGVLDLACGHGRIANRLAARGCRVTGLDATPLFLELARQDAAERGVDVEYVEGDMRELPWRDRFDAIANVFTSYGYFDDEGNREVLRAAHRALKPGGRFLIENNNLLFIMRNFREVDLSDRGGDFVVDRRQYELETGRMHTERTIVRDGRVRRARFFVRMFTAPELRDWLLAAGFASAAVYGRGGEPFSLDSGRMLTVARK